jgi:hypothetical protein
MSETAASTPRAEGSHDRPSVTPLSLESAHDALLQHYVRILKEVSRLHPVGGRGKLYDLFGRDLNGLAGTSTPFLRITYPASTFDALEDVRSSRRPRDLFS